MNSVRKLATILSRRKWIVIVTALVAAIVVAVGATQITETYAAEALLRLLPYGATGSESVRARYAERLASSYAALAESDLVTDQVEQLLRLKEMPDLTLETVPDTDLLRLTVTADDPLVARDVANMVATLLVRQEEEAYAPVAIIARRKLEVELETLEEELQSLENEYWNLVARVSAEPDQISELSRAMAEKQRLYDEMVETYGAASVSESLHSNMLSVVQPATLPTAPTTETTLPLRIVVAFLAGLIGGTGLAVALDVTDHRLFSTKQAETTTDLTVMGQIPEFDWGEYGALSPDQDVAADAFRRVRTRLFSLMQSRQSKTFLFTSAQPDEGKSTVVANLAYALAEAGRRVLVIDADMRRPTLHKLFVVPNHAGLSSVLLGIHDPDYVVQASETDDLFVLPSGPLPDHPAELLSRSERVLDMLATLEASYDVILIDSPPTLAVADAAILAPLVDGVIMVLRLSHSEEAAVTSVRDLLRNVNATLSGVIVNLADKDASFERYHYVRKY